MFLETLKDSSVGHLATATFMCKVSPRDQSVTWFLGDKQLKTEGRFVITQEEKFRTLVMKECTVEDR